MMSSIDLALQQPWLVLLLVFATTLLAAVLVSQLAHRSVLSTAALFLLVGFAVGPSALNLVHISPADGLLSGFVELALFAVLYTDGMRVGLRDLSSAWRLPGRALLLALPLTLLIVALLAHLLLGLSWAQAMLVGAVLSPTDPVFAAAVIGREEVPWRLRHLLNIESGLNDGLALPLVLIALAVVSKSALEPFGMLGELAGGVAIGVMIPWFAISLERSRLFESSAPYWPLLAIAIALLVFGLCSVVHANELLGAFAAGMTVATQNDNLRQAFHGFGELITELLKLGALLLFGALIAPSYLIDIGVYGWMFVALVLVAARPLAMLLAFIGSELARPEWVAAAWFGPRGFASVFFALLVYRAGIPDGEWIFHLIAVMVATSIVAHSSTDVLVARWFEQRERGELTQDPRDRD